MASNVKVPQESVLPSDFLKIRVYLYKYTPTFEYIGKGPNNIKSLKKTLVGTQAQVTQTTTLGNSLKELNALKISINEILRQINYTFVEGQLIPENVKAAYKKISPQYTVPAVENEPEFSIKFPEIVFPAGDPPVINFATIERITTSNVPISKKDAGDFTFVKRLASGYLSQVFENIGKKQHKVQLNLESIEATSTATAATAKAITDPFLVDRFFFELDEKYFSKFDITSLVTGYGVTQTLEDGISWKLGLLDEIITFNKLDTKNLESIRRPVLYPTPRSAEGVYREQEAKLSTSHLINNIALYESEEANGAEASEDDAIRIEIGMRMRGIGDKVRKEKLTSILERTPDLLTQRAILRSFSYTVNGERLLDPEQDGIRLSDLIQKNDFVTTFIYKHPLPPERLESALSSTGISESDNFYFDKEINLLRPQNVENKDLYLYDVEFNGFVTNINSGENVGRVNTVEISGGGILSLMKCTRSIYAATIFQGNIFDAAEVSNIEKLNVSQNIFVQKNPSQIAELLLENLYRFKFTPGGGTFDIDTIQKLGRFKGDDGKYLDKDGNAVGPRLLYTLPIYLLANVMRLREFLTTDTRHATGIGSVPGVGNVSGMIEQTRASGGLIYETNDFVSDFKSYFNYLSNSFADYNPTIKTPWEIMGDMRKSAYLEFFETLGGRIIYRTPQYNNAIPFGNKEKTKDGKERLGTLITSRQLSIINTSYKDTLNNLVTKQPLGYAVDLIGLPIPQLHYFYTNGKLLAQFGLFVANAQQNPNVRFKPIKPQGTKSVDPKAIQEFFSGIFKYCNFFLEYNNMSLKTGVIQAVGDFDVEVGRTYFDTENYKFGYIVRVQKNLTVGGAYTMSFDLTAVRDATFAGANYVSYQPGLVGAVIPRPQFRRLPELIDVTKEFGDTLTENISPSQARATPISREDVRMRVEALVDITKFERTNFKFGHDIDIGYIPQARAREMDQETLRIVNKKRGEPLTPWKKSP